MLITPRFKKRFTVGLFKLIANDELGSWCLKGQWVAKCNEQKGGIHGNPGRGSHQKKAATNRHRHTEKCSGDTYLKEYLAEKSLWNHQPPSRVGGERAWIRNNSQKGTIDLLWSASKATKHYNASYKSPKGPASPQRAAPHVTYCNRWQPLTNSLEFNLA